MPTEQELLEKIKSKGYWEILIRPLQLQNRFSKMEAQSILKELSVKHFGWIFPVVSSNNEECFLGQNYVEGVFDNSGGAEVWRLYQTGQFIYYRTFVEDWQSGPWYTGFESRRKEETLSKVKGINILVNEITMIFDLASRFLNSEKFGNQLKIKIILRDVLNRTLATDNPMAMLYGDYTCRIPDISWEKIYSKEDLDNFPGCAMEMLMEATSLFNWTKDERETSMVDAQKQFLEGKI